MQLIIKTTATHEQEYCTGKHHNKLKNLVLFFMILFSFGD